MEITSKRQYAQVQSDTSLSQRTAHDAHYRNSNVSMTKMLSKRTISSGQVIYYKIIKLQFVEKNCAQLHLYYFFKIITIVSITFVLITELVN